MGPIQLWLERTLFNFEPVAGLMRTRWGWPAMESVHFIGLALLFGSIATWDLRLLGVAKRVPIIAFHRLTTFAMLGFTINIASGLTFLVTETEQYIYNPAFHFKMLFIALAGLNVLLFNVTMFRRVSALPAGADAPPVARICGAASLAFWIAVIICGRMLTFYRPNACQPGEATRFIVYCITYRTAGPQ